MHKKAIAVLSILVFTGSTVAFATPGGASPIPEPRILVRASASSVAAMNLAVSSNAMAPAPAEASLIETDLPPAPPSPIAGLDLIPQSTTVAYAYPHLKLDPAPASLEYERRYLVREYRSGAVGDVLFKVNLVAMVALNVADYFSTTACLQHPGLNEANPLMKPFVKSPIAFAAAKAGLTAISYVSLNSLYKKSKPAAWVLSMASNLLLSYVVSNNIRLNALAR